MSSSHQDPAVSADLINPFIEALATAFSATVSADLQKRRFFIKKSSAFYGDLTGSVPLVGSCCEGYVSVSFPAELACALAQHLLCDESIAAGDEEVLDCIGEISNSVAGLARRRLAGSEYTFAIGMPVITEGGHSPDAYQDFTCIACQFAMFDSTFEMELRLKITS
jgi:chemotaxis protein CheX